MGNNQKCAALDSKCTNCECTEEPENIETQTQDVEVKQNKDKPSFCFLERNKDYTDPINEDYQTHKANTIGHHEVRENHWGSKTNPMK